MTRTPAGNSGLAKVAVQCSVDPPRRMVNQIWFSASTFVVKIATFAKQQTVCAILTHINANTLDHKKIY